MSRYKEAKDANDHDLIDISEPSIRGPRGPYQPKEQSLVYLPTLQYMTPLFRVQQFQMFKLIVHQSGDEVQTVQVPPSYCRKANPHTTPVEPQCIWSKAGHQLLIVLDIPLPLVIEVPLFRCTIHKNRRSKEASTTTHWFSHANATKVIVSYDRIMRSHQPIASYDRTFLTIALSHWRAAFS